MNSILEEITIDDVQKWFLSKPHLPLVRGYISPLVEDWSVNHAAPSLSLELKDIFVSSQIPRIIQKPETQEISTSLRASQSSPDLDLNADKYDEYIEYIIRKKAEVGLELEPFIPISNSPDTDLGIIIDKVSTKKTKSRQQPRSRLYVFLTILTIYLIPQGISENRPENKSELIANINYKREEKASPRVETEISQQQQILNLVRDYYQDISRNDADAVIQKWKSPKKNKLRQLVSNVDWVNMNKLKLVNLDSNQAQISIDATFKNKGNSAKEQRWVGTIYLEIVRGEWKITKIK